MKKSLLTTALFSLFCYPIFAFSQITIYAVSDGDWDQASTWNLPRVPNITDVVGVSEVVVTVNNANAIAKQVIVESGANQGSILYIVNGGILTVSESFTVNKTSVGNVELDLSGNGQLFVNDLIFLRAHDNNNQKLALKIHGDSYVKVNNNFTWDQTLNSNENFKEIDLHDNAILEVINNTNISFTGGRDFDIHLKDYAQFLTHNDVTILKTGGDEFRAILEGFNPIFRAGKFNLDQQGGTGNTSFTVTEGEITMNDSVEISNTQTSQSIAFFINGASSKVDFQDNLALSATTTSDIRLVFENKSKFYFGGNLTRVNGFGQLMMDPNTTLVFNGSKAQTVPVPNSISAEIFSLGMVEFANSSGSGITLTEDLVVDRQMELKQGIIHSDIGSMVVIGENATLVGGDSDNYISGPVKKIGLAANQEFTFPLGHLGKYAPMTIYSTEKATGEYKTRYINCPPPYGNVDPTQLPTPLDHVTELERWTMERSLGSPDVEIRLHWDDATATGITDFASLVVAMYDGTNWVNIGSSEPMGSVAAGQSGSIRNGINCPPPYGLTEFTFGSISQLQNLLPVVLTNFNAFQSNEVIKLNWVTSQEINTDQFVVESSSDAINFSRIAEVKAQGNSTTKHSYTAADANPKIGHNYYRLRQMDQNGMYTLSDVIGVEYSEDIDIQISPNPVVDFINIKGNFPDKEKNPVKVFDQMGRSVFEGFFPSKNGRIEIRTEELLLNNSGLYYVQVNIDNVTKTTKIFK